MLTINHKFNQIYRRHFEFIELRTIRAMRRKFSEWNYLL